MYRSIMERRRGLPLRDCLRTTPYVHRLEHGAIRRNFDGAARLTRTGRRETLNAVRGAMCQPVAVRGLWGNVGRSGGILGAVRNAVSTVAATVAGRGQRAE